MQHRQVTKTAPKDRTPYQQYTLTDWGKTPWPDLNKPSAAECEEVYTRLMAQHGDRLRPVHITAPSLEVAGCGEVPQVLDAIIRTMISANTKFEHADAALKSLIGKVGVVLDNKGLDATEYQELQHCLDYNYIRTCMSEQDLQMAIATAGNQKQTASRILTILADVYSRNKERANAFRNETPDNPADPTSILAADLLSDQEKQWEINMFEHGILNVEFLKKLSPEHAMNEMLCWKGIGVKTAACVLMFCMQQDILACDTHCIRLSKWLGWVPVEAKDELVFAHVDKRVPNHLKYALHQLFIQHGKDCILCKDDRNEEKERLKEVVCPLEDLLDRGLLRAHRAAVKAKSEAKKEAKAQGKSNTDEAKSKVEEEMMEPNSLQTKAKGPAKDNARTSMKTTRVKSKGKSKGKGKAEGGSDKENSGRDVLTAEGEEIVKDMVPITKKRTLDTLYNDDDDDDNDEVKYASAKHTRTAKKQPVIPIITRRTRSQTKAEQEKK